ncbi:MAG: phosphoglycerate dehydrogenase [Christensenellaceae bacterium]|nr:phosphoglycerate dehydrogenase [Christensenellaceae bacterium]
MANILVTVTKFEERCIAAREYMEAHGHKVFISDAKLRLLQPKDIIPIVEDMDAAIIGMDVWDAKLFDMAPRVKAVAKFGVGVDNIDLDEAARRGIYALNAAGANAAAVAEITIGLMVACLRNVGALQDDLRAGSWTRFLGEEIAGKTVGLIGFGQIARRVARILKAMDANVIVYNRTPRPELAAEYGVEFKSREEVIANADILSLHIPGTADNVHMMNDKTFAAMKKGAYFVNTGRGCLVDEAALMRAVESGHITAAGLDVFEKEPPAQDNPILRHPRIMCLPHTGGETQEAYAKIGLSVAKSVCQALAGETPDNWVNRW